MSIWRSPALEALFGGPLDESGITEASIMRLIADKIAESDQIDFKSSSYGPSPKPRRGWTDEHEFAKDISAFANHRGGVILIGVDDTGRVAAKSTPISVTSPEHEERRLRQALVNHQAPVLQPDFVWVRASSGEWYAVVIVPPSPIGPHAAAEGPGLRYPVRNGSETRWMPEAEVAERYRRRLAAQQDEQARVRQAVTDGCNALVGTTGLWLYATVVPESPVPGRLDQATVQQVQEWYQGLSLTSPLQRWLPATGRGIPAPGRVTFTDSPFSSQDEQTQIRSAYVELHVEGSAFAATALGDNDGGGNREVGELTLVDDMILLIDVTSRWCAHQAGAWGTATVVAGLRDAHPNVTALTEPLVLVRGDDRLRPIRAARAVSSEVKTETVADLAAIGTIQQGLSLTYQTLAGLLQHFGVAEPAQLHSDGTIAPAAWGSRSCEVEDWAKQYGVPHEPLPSR